MLAWLAGTSPGQVRYRPAVTDELRHDHPDLEEWERAALSPEHGAHLEERESEFLRSWLAFSRERHATSFARPSSDIVAEFLSIAR